VGEGSGTIISYSLLLKLAVARALVRRPRLLLLDDADHFADALGDDVLSEVLGGMRAAGCALLVATAQADRFPYISVVYRLDEGLLSQID
jgi:ATP-binding cassette subfamily C protein